MDVHEEALARYEAATAGLKANLDRVIASWPAGVDPADYRDLGGVKMTFPSDGPAVVEEIPPGP